MHTAQPQLECGPITTREFAICQTFPQCFCQKHSSTTSDRLHHDYLADHIPRLVLWPARLHSTLASPASLLEFEILLIPCTTRLILQNMGQQNNETHLIIFVHPEMEMFFPRSNQFLQWVSCNKSMISTKAQVRVGP